MSDNAQETTVVTAVSRVSGEPPSTREACLVVIYGLDLGKKYSIDQPSLLVGRAEASDIQIDQEAVSRNHCRIVNTGDAVLVRDLNSTNGTYINDQPIREQPLRDGDLLKIGRCIFKFLSGSNIENAYHEEIYRLTTIDGLTQVYNKRYFLETLEREIGRAQRYRRDLSLILFDIDHFKQVNDTYGHLAGDYVLKQLAMVIQERIRREDVLARYGGEEFAIILPEIDKPNALRFGEKIRRLTEESQFRFDDTEIPVTVSIGVGSLRPDVRDPHAFIKLVDVNLYQAKGSGRNCVVG